MCRISTRVSGVQTLGFSPLAPVKKTLAPGKIGQNSGSGTQH